MRLGHVAVWEELGMRKAVRVVTAIQLCGDSVRMLFPKHFVVSGRCAVREIWKLCEAVYIAEVFKESDVDEEGEREEEVDDEDEEEGENESKTAAGADDVPTKLDFVPTVARERERQLSKELKKKELADLEAVLAELGLDKKEEKDENGSGPNSEDKKPEEDPVEEIEEPLDPREVLKWMQSLKKKKSYNRSKGCSC